MVKPRATLAGDWQVTSLPFACLQTCMHTEKGGGWGEAGETTTETETETETDRLVSVCLYVVLQTDIHTHVQTGR